ncbi:hypothetical protein PQU94_17945 [Asticcacaulis sp. DXS10W]|uniref:Uncharacterized protein n=1 Tax=Asticcacaulis currens TaxID=2984210 RepID=A0ABT5IJP6_9CAUL|nr:hypothetical protein [Asticcacaulis currens]MDC7696162.1 hypothetical protein [Asticcacaulis currens]
MTYILEDDHITTPFGRYYLREVVDPYCSEYDASVLTDDQRRDIIDVVGVEALTEALERLYVADKHMKADEANRTIKLALRRLDGPHRP